MVPSSRKRFELFCKSFPFLDSTMPCYRQCSCSSPFKRSSHEEFLSYPTPPELKCFICCLRFIFLCNFGVKKIPHKPWVHSRVNSLTQIIWNNFFGSAFWFVCSFVKFGLFYDRLVMSSGSIWSTRDSSLSQLHLSFSWSTSILVQSF